MLKRTGSGLRALEPKDLSDHHIADSHPWTEKKQKPEVGIDLTKVTHI